MLCILLIISHIFKKIILAISLLILTWSIPAYNKAVKRAKGEDTPTLCNMLLTYLWNVFQIGKSRKLCTFLTNKICFSSQNSYNKYIRCGTADTSHNLSFVSHRGYDNHALVHSGRKPRSVRFEMHASVALCYFRIHVYLHIHRYCRG